MSVLLVEAAHSGRGVDVAFELPAGQCGALIGPNGAGKSTTLGMVAGTVRPSGGKVVVDGRALVDVERRIDVPVWRRRTAILTQRPVLFEHLDVLDNVAFAMRIAGVGHAKARDCALVWLRRVGGAEWARRRTQELSGGQAQRVALARALAAEPEVLLLDEPFAAVDVLGAAELRALVRRLLVETGQTCLMVTHDLADVATLADQVVVLDGGRVAQTTTVQGLREVPATEFAARLVGLNFLRSDSGVTLFAPSAARVSEDVGETGLPGVVLGVLSHGGDLRALVRVEDGTVQASVDQELGRRLALGTRVVVVVDPEQSRQMGQLGRTGKG